MRRELLVILGLAAGCGGGDIRVVGTDDGAYEGSRVWAQLADVEANEALQTQRSKVTDGAFEFVFSGAATDADQLGLLLQLETVEGSGCGASYAETIDGVQVGAIEVHTRDFLDGVQCLGNPQPETTTSDE